MHKSKKINKIKELKSINITKTLLKQKMFIFIIQVFNIKNIKNKLHISSDQEFF